LDAIAVHLPTWHAPSPRGGMCVWAELPPSTPSSALAARALEHGVRIAAGSRFNADGGLERRLRLPFTHPPEVLIEAVRRLSAAQDALGRHAAHELPTRWVA
jgi:DNA-binding transcriptional MocR family regulator